MIREAPHGIHSDKFDRSLAIALKFMLQVMQNFNGSMVDQRNIVGHVDPDIPG